MRRKTLIAFVVSLFICNIGFTHQCQAYNVPATHSSIPLRQTGGRPHDTNWGWGGYGNGYFNPEVFNPEDAESYDFMSSGMNKDYKYNLKYIAFYQEQMSIL